MSVVTTLGLPAIDVDLGNLDRAALGDLWTVLSTAGGRDSIRLAFISGGEHPDDAANAVRAMRTAVRLRLCH